MPDLRRVRHVYRLIGRRLGRFLWVMTPVSTGWRPRGGATTVNYNGGMTQSSINPYGAVDLSALAPPSGPAGPGHRYGGSAGTGPAWSSTSTEADFQAVVLEQSHDRAGRDGLLGRLVRPVQAAQPDARAARRGRRGPLAAGEDRPGREPAARSGLPGAEHPRGVRGGEGPAGPAVPGCAARGTGPAVPRRAAAGRRGQRRHRPGAGGGAARGRSRRAGGRPALRRGLRRDRAR